MDPAPPTDPAPRAYSQVPAGGRPYSDGTGSTASFDSPSEAFAAAPGNDEPAASDPVRTQAPGRRHLGKIIALTSVAVLLLVVIAGAGTELYLRHKVKDCVSQGFSQFTGAPVDVSLSGKPIMLQAFSKQIPFVQVDTTDTGDPNAMRLHLRMDDIKSGADASTIGQLNGQGLISYQRVLEMSKQNSAGSDPGLTSIKGNAADGTIQVDATMVVAIIPVPVSVTVKPEVVGGKVKFAVTKASALVFGIPSDFAQSIVDQMTKSMFSGLIDSVQVKSLQVTDSGVDFTMAGSNVELKQNVSSPNGSCSSLV